MNNKILTTNENILELSFPLILDTKNNGINNSRDYSDVGNDSEKINLFTPDLNEKPFMKIDRKNKKNEKTDLRDSDVIKTKLKSKKKERSKFITDDDYDVMKRGANELEGNDVSLLPLARPEAPIKKISTVSSQFNKKNNKQSSSKKNKKDGNAKNKDLDTFYNNKPENISISGPISVQDLASLLFVTDTEIIRSLFLKGIGVTINQVLDVNTCLTVGEDLGIQIEHVKESTDDNKKIKLYESTSESLQRRPPVIAVMGHVDHGKTTLLDKIRKAQTAQKEAGGITQKIGAYEVEIEYKDTIKKLTFLDTPGHEAFSGMRSRGVQVTDIAVLVVAADDGVKPQTVEAIKYIQSANVPIIVAINKIDKENADIENIKQQLTQYNLIPENWGGDTLMVPISAMKGTNIDNLLEMIILVAEVEDLKANITCKAQGTVLEAHVDKTKGSVATLLVQNGTLKIGNI